MDIFNEGTVIKVKLVTYAVLVFFSFFIFVGVAVMKDQHNFCPLYADANGSGPESNCNFPMAIAIMFQLLYTLYRIVTLLLLMIGKFTSDFVLFIDMAQLVYLGIDLICGFFFTFIGACILSAGYNDTCDTYNCSEIESSGKAAQAGAWISSGLWLFIGIYGFMFMWRTGKIPFIGGGGASQGATGTTGPSNKENPPTMETPPNNPDEVRY